jgi:hypothetical protein
MSTEAMAWVIRRSPYTGVKYTLHLMIADSANDAHDFELWARQRYFADKARISRQRACKYIEEMIKEGTLAELENHKKEGRPNRYRFLMPDLPVVFETRTQGVTSGDTPTAGQGVTNGDTPDQGSEGGVANGDRGVSPTVTGGVPDGDTGVSPAVTQNPKVNPTQPKVEPNARAGSAGEATASGRARGSASSSTSAPETSTAARSNGTARAANGKLDLRSASSAADAAARPPSSVAPPTPAAASEDEAPEAHPDVRRVVEYLGRAVAKQMGRRVKTDAWTRPIGLLLRRGPTEWADPEAIPVETVLAVIDWTFGPGAVRDSRGFSWADQVRSGEALRRHWLKIQPLVDAGGRRLATVPAGRRREDPAVQAEREMQELHAEWESGTITPENLFPKQARLAREAADRAARRSA